MLLQACLGVSVDGWRQQIDVCRPQLPPGIEQVALRGLTIGPRCIDLVFQRFGDRVVVFSEGEGANEVPLRLTAGGN
jgi:hypothetical protein